MGYEMNLSTPPLLAIVVPCYNEEAAFPFCLHSLMEVVTGLQRSNKIQQGSHLLFVDDGSRDNTWHLICSAAAENKAVGGLKLSRNYGHQAALLAGLQQANADVIISIDADMQDDTQCIEQMIDCYLKGNEVVYGVRSRRDSDSWFKRTSATLFYRVMTAMGVEQIQDHADFRLLSRRALKALLTLKEKNIYLRGMVPLVGFKSEKVFYSRAVRVAGETHYPLTKMISLAVRGITSSSIYPLRIIFHTGFIICLLSALMIIYTLCQKIIGNAVEGWTSISLAILFFGGVQLLCLGVVGEYIGKIYTEVKNRPLFFVEEEINSKVTTKDSDAAQAADALQVTYNTLNNNAK